MKVFVVLALSISALSALLGRASSQCISENDHLELPPGSDLSQVKPFSLRLLREVLPPSGNFFFSPYSIWTALVLAYFGSNGNTKSQMERSMHLTNREETLALYRLVDRRYSPETAKSNYTIDTANRIYMQEGLSLRECLSWVLEKEVQSLNFWRLEPAAATINNFVSKTTRGKIRELVTPVDVFGASMVLVNAVYFKGLLADQFKKENTRGEAFFVSPLQQTPVQMMIQNSGFKYGVSERLRAEVLEMPYGDGGVSMLVFLPEFERRGKELDQMIERLNPGTFEDAIGRMSFQDVIVKFPRFKFENTISDTLLQALNNMGISDLFLESANFTNFKPDGGLRATSIIHKAVIEVDEEGSEAAAATEILFITEIQPRELVRFTCNRPFLFMIKDNALDNILFVGAFRHP